ncbi:MAG: Uncharacterized protein FD147_1593 [Chloroflexi bacterium]|nr:MAG: Uncharacterized protein FD147_1593 [Chloroflexota bacterium]MBA4376339.1 hypothetical protein [Anaerolinea sp.]
MRKSALFFGTLIILLGAMLLAINLGVVTTAIWSFFWPAILVLLGVWFIAGPYLLKGKVETVERSIPLENGTEAEITFNYGAGMLSVASTLRPQELVGGSFVGGISDEVNRTGGTVNVKLNTPSDMLFPGNWVYGHQGINWNVGLTKEIPLKLYFHTGACEAKLNLADLRVTELVVETGASSTEIQLPQNAGYTRVTIKSGAAAVKINVPQGVAASIRESSGLSGINVDTSRFIQNGHTYQSADYATASNKVDISYEGGVGSVDIK